MNRNIANLLSEFEHLFWYFLNYNKLLLNIYFNSSNSFSDSNILCKNKFLMPI